MEGCPLASKGRTNRTGHNISRIPSFNEYTAVGGHEVVLSKSLTLDKMSVEARKNSGP